MLALACSAVAWAAPAVPPPADELRQRLALLEDELARMRVQLPAAADALHTVENRLEAMARELERLSAAREAEPYVKSAVDELRVEVDAIERRLASTQAQLSDLGATSEPAVRVGYADGVFLKTGPVTLALNMGLMPRYQGIVRLGRDNDSSFDLHHGEVAAAWVARRLRRRAAHARLRRRILGHRRARGHLARRLRRRAAAALAHAARRTISGAVFRQRLADDFRLTFAERTVATRAFSFDRDLGGELELALVREKLLLQVAVTDGVLAGPTVRNDNIDFAYTLRILGQPLGAMPRDEGDFPRSRRPRFAIGGSFQFNLVPNDQKVDLNGDGVVDNVEVMSAAGEVALKWSGLALEGEYFFRYEKPGAGLRHHVYQGAYGQLSQMVWRGLNLGARFSWAQPHVLGGDKLGLFGDQPHTAMEAGGVINYYVWRQRVRGQVSYDYRRDQAVLTEKIEQGHVVQVQVQAGFWKAPSSSAEVGAESAAQDGARGDQAHARVRVGERDCQL